MVKTPAPEIVISGQRITLKVSPGESPERVQEIIELVTERIAQVESRAGKSLPAHQVTVLAILELAKDYLEAKDRTEDFKSRVSQRSEVLLRLLEGESPSGESLPV